MEAESRWKAVFIDDVRGYACILCFAWMFCKRVWIPITFSAVEVLPSPNCMTEIDAWFGTGGWIAFSLSDWFSWDCCRELRTCSCSEHGIGIRICNDCPAAWICKCYCKSLVFPSHWSYGPRSEWADVRGMGRDAETLCTSAVKQRFCLQLDPISAAERDRLC